MSSIAQGPQGFTLIELVIASFLGSVLILAAVSIVQIQLATGTKIRAHSRAEVQAKIIMGIIGKSLQRLQLPVGDSSIVTSPTGFDLEYTAGAMTDNCLGTQALPGSMVQEQVWLDNNRLYCASQYQDLQSRPRRDRQPLANQITAFQVSLIRSNGDRIDAIDIHFEQTLKGQSFPKLNAQRFFIGSPQSTNTLEVSL